MLNLARAVNVAPKAAAPKKPFTMHRLRQLAVWGATAASALLIAVMASRSEVGYQRSGSLLASLGARSSPRLAAQTFDPQAETRRLSDAIRTLASNDEQIKTRLTAIEHNMDDMTGSISRQIEAVKSAPPSPPPNGPTVETTAMATTVMAAPLLVQPLIRPASPPPAQPAAYGVDIGSGLTIAALRARWAAIRSAHPQLLEGLEPIVAVREPPKTNRVELRLVAGPLAQLGLAEQLCASLTPFGLFCQPTIFDGQHLALR
jgi:hypothetical protein